MSNSHNQHPHHSRSTGESDGSDASKDAPQASNDAGQASTLAESAADTANRARSLARSTTREASALAIEGAQRLSTSARELATETLAKISHRAKSTQRQLNGYAGDATRYMAARPLRTAAFALFVGFALAKMTGRSRDD